MLGGDQYFFEDNKSNEYLGCWSLFGDRMWMEWLDIHKTFYQTTNCHIHEMLILNKPIDQISKREIQNTSFN